MSVVVGHQHVVDRLKQDLPPVTLLMGPTSVGKRTIVEQVLPAHDLVPADVLRYYERFYVEDARRVVRFLTRRPYGPRKVVVVRLDQATPEAMNALLKVTEEPPEKTSFLLLASRPPPLTIISRAQRLRCGYLSEDEVFTILTKRFGWEEDQARGCARACGGQMDRALDLGDVGLAKGPVLSLLKATVDGDHELFFNALAKFSPVQARLFRIWLIEALSGHWKVFTEAEGYGLQADRKAVRRISKVLDIGARPDISIKLALLATLETCRD